MQLQRNFLPPWWYGCLSVKNETLKEREGSITFLEYLRVWPYFHALYKVHVILSSSLSKTYHATLWQAGRPKKIDYNLLQSGELPGEISKLIQEVSEMSLQNQCWRTKSFGRSLQQPEQPITCHSALQTLPLPGSSVISGEQIVMQVDN